MKKQLILSSLLCVSLLAAEEDFTNYLTDDKNQLFDYEQKKNELETSKLRKSWVSPVIINYSKNMDKHKSPARHSDKYYESSAFSIGIDQPIFKSGGIRYTIKKANVLQDLNFRQIEASRHQSISKSLELLYNIKKANLNVKKLDYLIKNNNIEIKKKEEAFNAGLVDSSALNNALIEKNSNQTRKLEAELAISQLKSQFATLSDANPDKIKTPHLRLISLDEYKSKNSDIAIKELQSIEKKYNNKITWSKYLPTVSINARYTNSDSEENNLENFEDKKIGFSISIPISINSKDDIESSKVDYMKSVIQTQDSRRTARIEHASIRRNIDIISKQIALIKKDEKLYASLYRRTKDLAKAGEQTQLDVQTMSNALQIKKLDRRIYQIDRQLQLLTLYSKISD